MAEQQQQQSQVIMVVFQCPHCYGIQQGDGSIRWGCDALHPEVLRQMVARDQETIQRGATVWRVGKILQE